MIRTKTLGYIIGVYALGVGAYVLATLIVWGVLLIGAAAVGHNAPEYGTANNVTLCVLIPLFIYGEYRKAMRRREAEANKETD